MATTEKYYKIKSGLEAPSQDTLQVTESTRPTIRPSLNLNFAQAKVLDPRITFARASTATYYDGVTNSKAEENLLLQSQTFDNAYWTKTNITVTANSTTAPDGTTTAESILETATTGQHQVFRSAVITSSNTHVRSVFAKPNGRNWLAIYGGAGRSFFDLQNGVTGTVEAGYTASMIDAGNGWYRCILIGPAGTSSYAGLYNIADADNSISYAGDITKGLFIWGAQFEQRSAVTAYTPTTTQPITNYIPVLQTASANVARFDHNPVTGESLGLLVEEQRTNQITYSDDLANAAWTKGDATVESNVAVAPDGTLTMDKLVPTAVSAIHFTGNYSTSVTSGVAYTYSFYAKKAEYSKLKTLGVSTTWGSQSCTFDLVAETATATGSSGTITNIGNEIYRCTWTATALSTQSASIARQVIAVVDNLGNSTFTGDGYSGIYIWGAQLEAGSVPTSYIPTVASQVTRSADSASMTGANLFSWFNPSQGTLYAEANHIVGVNQQAYFAQIAGTGSGTSYGESIAVGKFDSSAIGSGQRIKGIVYVINSNDANLVTASNITTSPVKVSLGYKVNDFAASIDGAASLTDTSGVLPVINSVGVFSIGSIRGGGLYINSTIKKIAYYPARLTNEQLVALTS
jgi:hypothetical protein